MRFDPRHPEAESLWRAIAQAELRSVAVVAAAPGEGCTSVAETLWRRAAEAGRSALLVDLNRDRPAPSLRQLSAEPGVVARLGNSGLGVLAEPGEAALANWRDPNRLREALAGWHQQWDTVVLDTAPLLAKGAQGLPGLAAAAAADAAVLVVLAGRTDANQVREAAEALRMAGARLLGSVLNDRDNPALRAELEREARRLRRVAPGLTARLTAAFQRSSLLGMRV
jgi:Mrp family chromosome partitioning ATPase